MRAARLRRGEDIARVREAGSAHGDRLFSLRALPNDQPTVRVAVAASRAAGGAVRRNRARRRVREAIRVALLAAPTPRAGMDLVLIARPASIDASPTELRSAAARQVAAVLR